MFEHMENFKIENIYIGPNILRKTLVESRRFSTIALRVAGISRYTFPEIDLETHPGDIIFLPRGSSYVYESLSDSQCRYAAVRFESDSDETTPFVCSVIDFPEYAELPTNLADMWKFGGMSEHYKCYSIVYNLLSYMKNMEKLTYADKLNLNVIAPAISYLKEHIYESDLKIDTLIQLCSISGTYFHKIFQANFSTSPQKYILSKRLSQAKSIIDNGDFNTISEIAQLVGYNDPLYFSRAFKKKYGVSPLNYAKQIFM